MTDSTPEPTAPPLGVQLGLGPFWQPGPGGWDVGPMTDTQGNVAHLLRVHTADGSVGILLSQDDLRNMADQLTKLATGITIARVGLSGPATNGHQPPRAGGPMNRAARRAEARGR